MGLDSTEAVCYKSSVSSLQRLLARTAPDGDCWIVGGKPNNYHGTSLNGRNMGAHRAAWILFHGAIPKGLSVCHECDRPGCVRPDHLFLGTHQENMDDRRRKGRPVGVLSIVAKAETCCGEKRLIMAKAKRGVHLWWEVRCANCNRKLEPAS